jgi:hypothetical protein
MTGIFASRLPLYGIACDILAHFGSARCTPLNASLQAYDLRVMTYEL